MPLFRSKKTNKTELDPSRIMKLEGAEIQEDGLDVELFHIAALMEGTSEAKLRRLEKKIFGKTFDDLLREGYCPSLAIKGEGGTVWTTKGKSP